MKLLISLHIVLFVFFAKYVASEDEAFDYTLDLDEERCCHYGESLVLSFSTAEGCASASAPDEIEDEYKNKCQTIAKNCCAEYYKKKEKCMHAMKYASEKRCRAQDGYVGKTCCEECIIGRLTGETKGEAACGEPPSPETHLGGDAVLRKIAYHTCCVAAARQPTTTEKVVPTITTEKVTTTPKPRERCKPDACEHRCDDESGKVVCSCHEGYRLQHDKRSCKDINECAEAVDDLCTADGTVCHNIAGAFKCVPLQKRDVSLSCPPGYMRNVEKRVCDDIDECNLPSPPCPKYLCKNTVGGYTCGNTPGKPYEEALPEGPTAPAGPTATQPGQPSTRPKNDICPSGFRAGENDDCDDIDECMERLDDCQRLSQYCINTHGAYFCQDHGSRHCKPGFKADPASGKCEDINECDEPDTCQRREICINQPGAYRCESKISTLPKLHPKNCQEGTRSVGGVCLDIDECVEGTHLCDAFQNCINKFGGHECRCKQGYEMGSSGSCEDINECLSSRRCGGGERCENFPGGYRCESSTPSRSYTPTQRPAPPPPRRPAPWGPRRPGPHFITVGVTYGQRGPHSRRPTLSRRQHTGESVAHCPDGYVLQVFDECVDVDECARQFSECSPEQECTNFYGGHSCTCPDGYQLDGTKGCQDIDECQTNKFCSSNSKCLNTVGSFHCQCDPGFYNSAPQVCLDVDECAEFSPCDQYCTNTWGTYRCSCDVGYRLGSDNSTCEDIDECAEWSSSGRRGVLCVGRCENVPGSYRCHCPSGYRMADDGRNCIDINECETRQAHCARGAPGVVCQNTRGGYLCHTIRCPSGYQLKAKHKCSLVERSCAYDEKACFARPRYYSYHYVTIAARMQLPRNGEDLFKMYGPQRRNAILEFSMRLKDVKPGPNVRAAEERCFSLVQSGRSCRLKLHCRLDGPQVAPLEIVMSLYAPGRRLVDTVAARLIVIVSEYEF